MNFIEKKTMGGLRMEIDANNETFDKAFRVRDVLREIQKLSKFWIF